MAVEKYLQIGATGITTEKAAIDSGTGAPDAGKIPALNADGLIDPTMLPAGLGQDFVVAKAIEALAENDVVTIYLSGTLNTRLADATDETKPAHGYVTAAVEMNADATIRLNGVLPGAALTPGARYFLSAAVPGGVTDTAPAATGNILQVVGVAVSETQIKFRPLDPIIRA